MTPDIIDSWLAIRKISELLTIMIETRFLDLIVGNNQFQSIFGSIDHNSMIVTTRIFNSTMILELIYRPD